MEDKNLMSADVDIVVRFFSAIDRLKADGCIGGLKTITDRYGINLSLIHISEPTRRS